LSYIALNGWKDIYGHRNGYSQIPKDSAFYNSRMEVDSIITGNDKLHSKFRRILAHAFSEKALRDQEPLVKTYVDLLMKKLHEQSNNGNTALDMVARYNWATFDLIGDLSFGEPFGSLEACVYHPWISMIFNGIKAGVYIGAIGRIPGAMALVKTFMPKRFMAAIEAHRALTIAKVNKRLEQTTDRADFMTYITRQKDEAGMTAAEMYVNASIIIIAGSETTATVLSGTTYLLLRNPRVLKKLVDEIRGTFMNEDDINFATVNKLEYTIAVLNEAMRMYPAVPTGLPRRLDAEGRMINDRWVPGNVSFFRFCRP
jgi:cytochrome P450